MQRFQRSLQILAVLGQRQDRAIIPNQPAGLSGVCEERHRLRRADKHQHVDVLEELPTPYRWDKECALGNSTEAALRVGHQNFVEEPNVARSRDPAGDGKRVGLRRGSANNHSDPPRIGAYSSCHRPHGFRVGQGRCVERYLSPTRGRGNFTPRGIRRQDHRRNSRRRQRGAIGCLGCGADIQGTVDATYPIRHRRCQSFDVGGQRRVERKVIGSVVTDDIDHRRAGAAGVVQIG